MQYNAIQHLIIYRPNGSAEGSTPYNPKSPEIQGKTAISELCKDHQHSLEKIFPLRLYLTSLSKEVFC